MFQRVFAAELNAAAVQFPGKGLAEPAVLTPGGAVLSLVFCSGALLECHGCGNQTVHARMADPTGAFFLQADSHSADARTILCSLETPCFVTVIGKPFLAGAGRSARCIIKVLDVRAVDRYTRDVWVLRTAEITLDRFAMVEEALRSGKDDPLARPSSRRTASIPHACVPLPVSRGRQWPGCRPRVRQHSRKSIQRP